MASKIFLALSVLSPANSLVPSGAGIQTATSRLGNPMSTDYSSSRRAWMRTAFVVGTAFSPLVVVAADSPGATEQACKTTSDPFKTTKVCFRYGRDKDGRLRPVAADENGVSCSSVRNPSRFSAPWRIGFLPEEFDAGKAWESLKREVAGTEGVIIREVDDAGYYLRATGPSAVPPGSTDDMCVDLLCPNI